MLLDGECMLEDLADVDDADELCRRLLAWGSGWGSSTRHMEAIALLARAHGTGARPTVFVALMLCACRRWSRVSAKLIAALEDCGLMDDAELDELAERFLSDDSMISYPLVWVSPQWLEIDVDDGTSRAVTVSEDALGQCPASFAPPLRRWRPVARSEPTRPDSTTSFGARTRSSAPWRRDHPWAARHGRCAPFIQQAQPGSAWPSNRVVQRASDRTRQAMRPRRSRQRAAKSTRRHERSVRAWHPRHAETTSSSTLFAA